MHVRRSIRLIERFILRWMASSILLLGLGQNLRAASPLDFIYEGIDDAPPLRYLAGLLFNIGETDAFSVLAHPADPTVIMRNGIHQQIVIQGFGVDPGAWEHFVGEERPLGFGIVADPSSKTIYLDPKKSCFSSGCNKLLSPIRDPLLSPTNQMKLFQHLKEKFPDYQLKVDMTKYALKPGESYRDVAEWGLQNWGDSLGAPIDEKMSDFGAMVEAVNRGEDASAWLPRRMRRFDCIMQPQPKPVTATAAYEAPKPYPRVNITPPVSSVSNYANLGTAAATYLAADLREFSDEWLANQRYEEGRFATESDLYNRTKGTEVASAGPPPDPYPGRQDRTPQAAGFFDWVSGRWKQMVNSPGIRMISREW